MRRILALIFMTSALAVASGCGQPCRRPVERESPRVSLLFDDVPGHPSASQVVHRSNWPSTVRFWDSGQIVVYQEYVSDFQRAGHQSGDHFRRHFRSSRTGQSRR